MGLLPLPDQKKDRDEIIHRSYRQLQEFLRISSTFGPQRRESEGISVSMGLANLARRAGYPDPQRLTWAMEARESADFRDGQLLVTVDDVTISLTIDPAGKPTQTVRRAGKILKDIPAKLTKNPQVAALRERRKTIQQQYSRMRHSFEAAMCRADIFTGEELRELCVHPVLSPMLEQLVFIGVDDKTLMGYPVENGSALFRHDFVSQPLEVNARVRVAHALDLLYTGEWSAWQREAFVSERIQPFKQVFREVYLATEAEQVHGNLSRRYAGQQVQPNKALALLNGRGWISSYHGDTNKTYHHANITAWVSGISNSSVMLGDTSADLEWVYFQRAGDYKWMPLSDVPPIVFSEAMRDLDLVVSVAHLTTVDPEATTSTVEMRAALVRETCALLKITNVKVEERHALIEGKLGQYAVHLGSATVHRMPGGSLCIIPAHAQNRGRVFLPFVDDDPMTAEVISKVILLARDSEIKDPSILSQIYRAG